MSTKIEGKQFTQDPTFSIGVKRFLQINENGENKLAILKCNQDITLQAKEGISMKSPKVLRVGCTTGISGEFQTKGSTNLQTGGR